LIFLVDILVKEAIASMAIHHYQDCAMRLWKILIWSCLTKQLVMLENPY